MVKQLSQDEKAARAAEELRALIREAHETMQALKDVIKEGQDVVEQHKKIIHGLMIEETKPLVIDFTRTMHAALQEWLNTHAKVVHDALIAQLERWGKQLSEMTGGLLGFDGMVIDSRGEIPRILPGDSEEARRLIADPNEYKIVINPNGEGRIAREGWKHRD